MSIVFFYAALMSKAAAKIEQVDIVKRELRCKKRFVFGSPLGHLLTLKPQGPLQTLNLPTSTPTALCRYDRVGIWNLEWWW